MRIGRSADGFYLIITDQPGPNSWPISASTFILMPKEVKDATTAGEALKFFAWAYKNGDKAADELDYVPHAGQCERARHEELDGDQGPGRQALGRCDGAANAALLTRRAPDAINVSGPARVQFPTAGSRDGWQFRGYMVNIPMSSAALRVATLPSSASRRAMRSSASLPDRPPISCWCCSAAFW